MAGTAVFFFNVVSVLLFRNIYFCVVVPGTGAWYRCVLTSSMFFCLFRNRLLLFFCYREILTRLGGRFRFGKRSLGIRLKYTFLDRAGVKKGTKYVVVTLLLGSDAFFSLVYSLRISSSHLFVRFVFEFFCLRSRLSTEREAPLTGTALDGNTMLPPFRTLAE